MRDKKETIRYSYQPRVIIRNEVAHPETDAPNHKVYIAVMMKGFNNILAPFYGEEAPVHKDSKTYQASCAITDVIIAHAERDFKYVKNFIDAQQQLVTAIDEMGVTLEKNEWNGMAYGMGQILASMHCMPTVDDVKVIVDWLEKEGKI